MKIRIVEVSRHTALENRRLTNTMLPAVTSYLRLKNSAMAPDERLDNGTTGQSDETKVEFSSGANPKKKIPRLVKKGGNVFSSLGATPYYFYDRKPKQALQMSLQPQILLEI